MTAIGYQTPEMRRAYLQNNRIVGWFADYDIQTGAWRLFEATSKTSGWPTDIHYPTKDDAITAGKAWEEITGLPRLDRRFIVSHQAPHVWAIHDSRTGNMIAELDDAHEDSPRSDEEMHAQAEAMAKGLNDALDR